MKRTLQTILFALVAIMMPIGAWAEDFVVDGIYYSISSDEDKTVEVAFSGESYSSVADEYTGEVTIPATVIYEGTTYDVTSIGVSAFRGCTSLTSVTIPEGVTTIGTLAFQKCSSLTSITIPESVSVIGNKALQYCSSLTSITIPQGVTTIGNYAFTNCTSLTSIIIPENSQLTTIGSEAFYDCYSLTGITIPSSVTSIGDYAFSCCAFLSTNFINQSDCTDGGNWGAMLYTDAVEVDGMIIKDNVLVYARGTLTSANIPEGVTSIGDYAFFCRSKLTSVIIPESVTTIGEYAFSECTSLAAANIPDGVTTIGYSAFSYCSSLIDISIPISVSSIEHYAFSECVSLESVIIPEGVTTIGEGAFSGCSSIESVNIPNTVTTISQSAFSGCTSLASITIPESVTYIGGRAFAGTQWLANQADGVVYINKMAYTYNGEMPENCAVEIAEGTTAICKYAFSGFENLVSVTIPSSVATILSYAFYESTNLSSVKLSTGLKDIGDYAFKGTKLSTAVIPEGVETLSWGVFYQCASLTSVALPNSMTEIERLCFNGCTALTDVHYNGTATEWNAITIGDTNTPLYGATKHYYVDGFCTVDEHDGHINSLAGVTIRDGVHEAFAVAEDAEMPNIVYTRTLPNQEWNSLYVPFEIEVTEELLADYEVAYYNNMHAYDKDGNGTIDEMDMEVILIKEGTLHANHPYFIRAKNEDAKEMTLELNDATLYSTAEENRTSITTSSAYMSFELTGVYEQMAGEDGVYAINTEGAWSPIAEEAKLNPFRLFLKMTERSGSPVKVDEQALSRVRIRVAGEGSETGIYEVETENGEHSADVYDLSGRRVAQPQKGGIYIVGGKKMAF